MRTVVKPLAAGSALAAASAGLVWRQVRKQQPADAAADPGNAFLRTYGPWALITGAARPEGLGYSFARHLAGRGFNLVLVDIAEEELAARAAELRAKYLIKVRPIALDLGRDGFLDELLPQTADLAVGLLVCNHMWTPKDTPTIMEMDLSTHLSMLANCPQWMVMDADSVAVDTLASLAEGPVLIPGLVNKAFLFTQTRLLPRRTAVNGVGRFMASGLSKATPIRGA